MAKVKSCVHCGEPFVAKHHQQQFCSKECANDHQCECAKLAGERRVQREAERAAAERRRAYLARRDAEYAKLGTRVTVEVRDLRDSELGCIMRVETRGQRCIGWHSCGKVSHN